MISHGKINGAPTSPLTAGRARNRNRVRPKAVSVPRTRQIGATMHATTIEFTSAACSSWSWNASVYQWNVTPSSGNASTFESLMLNSIKITSGPNKMR